MAEDVANHYMVKIDSRFPHSKNIRKNLRLPLLAITRRILLPRIHYAELQHSEVGTFGGVNHIDPTYAKSKVRELTLLLREEFCWLMTVCS